MKILFLTHRFYPDIGGIEVNSEILANAFQNEGHEVRLVTWTVNSGEKSFSFTVIRKPSTNALLKHHHWADVVFENNPCLRLSWPSIFFKKPSVIALRTWIRRNDGKKGWQDRFKLLWLQSTSAVIAVSESVRKADWSEAIVIGNPYRSDLFKVLIDVPKTSDFVFMGRLVSDKGVSLAIQAFHDLLIARGNRNLSMTIIGDGPERESLKSMVVKLQLTDQVTFTGSLRGESLVKCLNKHRFLLVPSLWKEPFGNVALEGMACGCIPLVSNDGGLPDAIGEAGLKFARGNVEDLVSSMIKVLSNSDLENHLRSIATNHLVSHQPNVVARRYLEVIQTAYNEAG